jgi:hypothetical protein
MFSLHWSSVAAASVLTLLLSLPSVAKSCPRRGPSARGGYSYLGFSPANSAYSSSSAAIETRASNNETRRPAAGSPSGVIPAAAVQTVGAPLPPPRVAPLSEQTGSDNFGNSGQ